MDEIDGNFGAKKGKNHFYYTKKVQTAYDNNYPTRTVPVVFVIDEYLQPDSKFEYYFVFQADFAISVSGEYVILKSICFRQLTALSFRV
jgi:hypothetical protein